MDEIQAGNMLALPQAPSFEPWVKAWGETCVGSTCAGIKGYFWNSIRMVIPAVAISTVLGALNGYVLTKWRFKGAQAGLRPDALRLLHPVPGRCCCRWRRCWASAVRHRSSASARVRLGDRR